MTTSAKQTGEMKPLKVKVETKGWSGEFEVENGFQAIKAFFKAIKEHEIGIDQVGLLGFWYRADGEKIAFRIPPALFEMGLISADRLHDSLLSIGDFQPEDLMAMVVKDSWMVEGMSKDRTRPD